MDANLQHAEFVDTASENAIAALDSSAPGTQPILPPATKSNTQLQQIGTKISDFLANLLITQLDFSLNIVSRLSILL